MEIHLFKTDDVENKIYELIDYFDVINFAVLGIKEYYDIKGDHLMSFDTVIKEAKNHADRLAKSMNPLSLNWNPKELIVLTECEVVENK